jgi:hypothetical protein
MATDPPRFYMDHFINVTGGVISLTTFTKLTPPDCNETRLIKMNEFSQSNGKWKSDNFAMKKFDNLNQCGIVANMFYPQSLALQVDSDLEGKPTAYRGYITKFNEIMSKKMNFTFKYNPLKIIPAEDPRFLYTMDFDETFFQIGMFQINYELHSFRHLTKHVWNSMFTITKPFTQIEVVVLISRFKPYTMWEKVFLPFDAEVWWWLIGSLITLAVISGLIWMFGSKKVKNFVFGSNVNAPLVNMM